MEVPLLADPPDAPDCVGAAQLKVVDATVPDNAMLVAFPEQMVCDVGVAVIVGEGLITTVTGPNTAAAQPPAAAMVFVTL